MKIAKSAPEVLMCEAPETFNVDYFFNKGLLYMHGKDVFFYEVGDKVKAETDGVEVVASADYEELRKEVDQMRKELGGFREEIKVLRERITDLAMKSSKQNERIAEAVELMMKMAKWMEKTLPQTQQRLPPGPSSEVRQPGQGGPSLQLTTSSVQAHVNPVCIKAPDCEETRDTAIRERGR